MKFIKDLFIYSVLAIGISPLSSSLRGYNIKMPIMIAGIFFLLLFNPPMRSLLQSQCKMGKVIMMTLCLLILCAIGMITGGYMGPVFRDFIAIYFFFFFFFYSSKSREESEIFESFIIKFFTAITFYELIVIILGVSQSATLLSIRIINLVVCPFTLSMIYLRKNKITLSIFFILICSYMSIRSAMRINFLFPVLYGLFLLYTFFGNKSIPFKNKFVLVAILWYIVVVAVPYVNAYIEADNSRVVHMRKRTIGLVHGESDEVTRKGIILLLVNEPADFLMPQGLGWENHTLKIMDKYRSRYEVMSTMDSNLLYCIYHFGLFLGIGVIIAIFYSSFCVVKNFFIFNADSSIAFASILLIALLSMFSLKSWIFVYSSFGLVYGIIFAYSKNITKYKM